MLFRGFHLVELRLGYLALDCLDVALMALGFIHLAFAIGGFG